MRIEQILALLTTKFSGVRKDVLTNIAMNFAMAAATEEDAKKLVDGLTEDKVNAFSKDYRSNIDREVTESNKTFETRLREKFDFKEKEGKKDQNPGDDPTKTTNPEIAALTKQIASLTKLVGGMVAEKITTSRRDKIESLIKDVKDESYKSMIRSGFGYMNFENDDKFNEYMTGLKADVEKHVQDQADEGLRRSGHIDFGRADENGVSAGVAAYVKDVTSSEGGSNLGGKSL